MALLDTAVTRIGTTLDIDATCGELADFVVPELADAAGVELFQQDRPGGRRQTPPGVMRLRRAAASAAPQLRATLREIGATGVSLEYEAGSPIRRRLDAGESWMFDLSAGDVPEGAYADWIARYRAVGVHSVLISPMGTEDRLLGTLSMVRVRPSPPSRAKTPWWQRSWRPAPPGPWTGPSAMPASTRWRWSCSGPC